MYRRVGATRSHLPRNEVVLVFVLRGNSDAVLADLVQFCNLGVIVHLLGRGVPGVELIARVDLAERLFLDLEVGCHLCAPLVERSPVLVLLVVHHAHEVLEPLELCGWSMKGAWEETLDGRESALKSGDMIKRPRAVGHSGTPHPTPTAAHLEL